MIGKPDRPTLTLKSALMTALALAGVYPVSKDCVYVLLFCLAAIFMPACM
jgi:hypothetical protein